MCCTNYVSFEDRIEILYYINNVMNYLLLDLILIKMTYVTQVFLDWMESILDL